MRTSRVFDVFLVGFLIAGVLAARQYRTEIGDWWFLRSYQPSVKVVEVASRAGFNDHGTKLFYRADPEFVDKATIANRCDIENLACLTSAGAIVILDEPGKADQTTVSAAHEVLHLAYRRLGDEDKAMLAPLLDEAYDQLRATTDLVEEVANQPTVEDRRDELHSLLGSEYAPLPQALEDYYRRYFSDRSKVVAAERRAE